MNFAANLKKIHTESSAVYRPRANHVALVIGGLRPGGAERQIINLAIGLKRAGWRPSVWIWEQGAVEAPHYRELLEKEQIDVVMVAPCRQIDAQRRLRQALETVAPSVKKIALSLPQPFQTRTLELYRALLRHRPVLLISYLDWQNCLAGVAGALAGVPRHLMSGRNLNPTRFRHLYKPEALPAFRRLYKALLALDHTRLSNNTSGGARSYARWLGEKTERITVIPNALSEGFLRPLAQERVKAMREAFGLKRGQPLILGVFRITREKRPLDFIKTVERLRRKQPELRAILCGMEADPRTRRYIEKNGLAQIVLLAGIAGDVPALMQMADLLLHPAAAEGMPNVILEAQAMGLPVVCTNISGNRDALADVWRPFMAKVGAIDQLAESCERLLIHDRKTERRGAARLTKKNFSVKALAERTLAAADF